VAICENFLHEILGCGTHWWHKRASTKTRIFRQFMKVFSLESQVSMLYGKLIHQAKPLDDWSSSGNAGNIEMLNTGTQDRFSGH